MMSKCSLDEVVTKVLSGLVALIKPTKRLYAKKKTNRYTPLDRLYEPGVRPDCPQTQTHLDTVPRASLGPVPLPFAPFFARL